MKFLTIGVYGFTETAFFNSLQAAGVDTFCDIRWRRGMRGQEYGFANSTRLQHRLAELSIRYLHFRELAPSPALRARQTKLDQAHGVAQRQRTTLSAAFIDGYCQERLATFNSRKFSTAWGLKPRPWLCFAWSESQPLAIAHSWPTAWNGSCA